MLEDDLLTLYRNERGRKYSLKKDSMLLVSLGNYDTLIENLGIQILMHNVNTKSKDMHAHRSFIHPEGLSSLETQKSANTYNIIGYSVPNVLEIPKFFKSLIQSNIPVLSKKRKKTHPIIIAGGMGITNPETFAPFVDLFVMGEGQDAIVNIANIYSESSNKTEFLKKAAQIPGVYVPSFFNPIYSKNNFKGYNVKKEISQTVKIQRFKDYSNSLISSTKIRKQTGSIMIDKGCKMKCSYCQYSHVSGTYNPIPTTKIIEGLNNLQSLDVTQVYIISASTTNHPQMNQILNEVYKRNMIPILGTTTIDKTLKNPRLLDIVHDGYNELSFPIDASSYRLRKQIGKAKITDEKIIELAKLAIDKGIKTFRIYNVLNLPSETREDHEQFINLLNRIHSLDESMVMNIFCSPLFPQPKTTYENVISESTENTMKKIDFIYTKTRDIARKLPNAEPVYSFESEFYSRGEDTSIRVLTFPKQVIALQNILLRGDRKTGLAIYDLYTKGSLDYSHMLKLECANQSFEIFPWSHIE